MAGALGVADLLRSSGWCAAAWLLCTAALTGGSRAGLLAPRGESVATRMVTGVWAPRMLPVLLSALITVALGWLTGSWVAVFWSGTVCAVVLRMRMNTRRTRARRAEDARVVEGLRALSDELRAGRSALAALETAARLDPLLRAAVEAGRAGLGVGETVATTGHRGHRWLGAAWVLQERHGGDLATAVRRIAHQMRAEEVTARVVSAELSSARSTARLLILLPAMALAISAWSGARPWEFLFSTWAGSCVLAVGTGCGLVGLSWIEHLARRAER